MSNPPSVASLRSGCLDMYYLVGYAMGERRGTTEAASQLIWDHIETCKDCQSEVDGLWESYRKKYGWLPSITQTLRATWQT